MKTDQEAAKIALPANWDLWVSTMVKASAEGRRMSVAETIELIADWTAPNLEAAALWCRQTASIYEAFGDPRRPKTQALIAEYNRAFRKRYA